MHRLLSISLVVLVLLACTAPQKHFEERVHEGTTVPQDDDPKDGQHLLEASTSDPVIHNDTGEPVHIHLSQRFLACADPKGEELCEWEVALLWPDGTHTQHDLDQLDDDEHPISITIAELYPKGPSVLRIETYDHDTDEDGFVEETRRVLWLTPDRDNGMALRLSKTLESRRTGIHDDLDDCTAKYDYRASCSVELAQAPTALLWRDVILQCQYDNRSECKGNSKEERAWVFFASQSYSDEPKGVPLSESGLDITAGLQERLAYHCRETDKSWGNSLDGLDAETVWERCQKTFETYSLDLNQDGTLEHIFTLVGYWDPTIRPTDAALVAANDGTVLLEGDHRYIRFAGTRSKGYYDIEASFRFPVRTLEDRDRGRCFQNALFQFNDSSYEEARDVGEEYCDDAP